MAVTFQLLTAASPSGASPGVLSRSDARRQTTPLGSVLVQPSGQVFDDPMLILAHRLDLRSRIARLDYAGRFRRASAWRTMTGALPGLYVSAMPNDSYSLAEAARVRTVSRLECLACSRRG
jgi:hypothetical protein